MLICPSLTVQLLWLTKFDCKALVTSRFLRCCMIDVFVAPAVFLLMKAWVNQTRVAATANLLKAHLHFFWLKIVERTMQRAVSAIQPVLWKSLKLPDYRKNPDASRTIVLHFVCLIRPSGVFKKFGFSLDWRPLFHHISVEWFCHFLAAVSSRVRTRGFWFTPLDV